MIDVQNQVDERDIHIPRVGVKKVHLPLQILEKGGSHQNVMGEISLCADLSKKIKGTHMSRFMEILNRWSLKIISSREIEKILRDVIEKLGARRAEIVIRFRYFIEKSAPRSGITGMLDYMCEFDGRLIDDTFTFVLGVEVPISTVCPCSREIARYGAHNQRAVVKARISYLPDAFIWIEDLVREVEKTGSFEIFPIIKRSDEKHITEKAYENPKFVEDVVRDIVGMLTKDNRVCWFEVECEASESIHNHNAFAYQQEVKPNCSPSLRWRLM